jgi:hypothetical protein
MNPFRVIKSFNIFKNKPVCMDMILDFESVDPFTFNEGMKGFYAGIIPREGFLGIASLHFGSCFPVFFRNILASTVAM